LVPLSLLEIAAATGGRVINCEKPESFAVSAVSTDSRALQENSLFVAIRGENFDGHDFAQKAVQNGAVAVMCQREVQGINVPAVLIKDTTKALLDLAGYYRLRFDIPVVGITGSVGKTTTKELAACVLRKGFNTLKTEGNLNNHIGVPLTLLRLSPEVTAAVVEMGMNHFGEIERLSKAVKPSIGVITVIGMSHVEYFGSKENIMKAKLEILSGIDKTGILVLNGDDPLLWGLKGKLPVKTV
jgi:UDP-N-acetylmuramoyl-tripeptide--D-alanyl-D-alanine ligase